MVGVVAHERGQVESNGESAAAVFEEIFVALVRFFRRCEAGEHAHRPEFAAIAGRVNAARVGRLAGIAEVFFVIPIGGEIGLRVEAADRRIGDRAETRMAVLVEVGAGRSADRFFGRFLERRCECPLGPLLLRCRGMTAFKDAGNRAFGDCLAQIGFRLVLGHSVPLASSHDDFDDRGAIAMLQNDTTDRAVGEEVKFKFLTTGRHKGHRGTLSA